MRRRWQTSQRHGCRRGRKHLANARPMLFVATIQTKNRETINHSLDNYFSVDGLHSKIRFKMKDLYGFFYTYIQKFE